MTFRIISVFIISAVILMSCSSYPTTNSNSSGTATTPGTASSTTYNAPQMRTDILKLINQYRASIGRGSLKEIESAESQAEVHSANMANGKTPFSHDGFDQRIAQISKDLGGGVRMAAENVAYGQMSAKEVVDGWLKSPGHKKNIEGDYNLTGIGTARNSKGVIYFTQIFLRK